MCGIAGIIPLTNNIKTDKSYSGKLLTMLDMIKKRGPDGQGIDIDKDYAIGNVRLNITGGDQGKQPIKIKGNSLVFNGEIYNLQDLKRKLEKNNINSDTLLLFKLFQQYKTKSLDSINGMYAFCFVANEDIYLVRDRFGKKPLFYTIKDDILYFASEIKAFYEFIEFKINISDEYQVLETEIGEKTIYKNIYQVPAGGYIKINRQTRELSKRHHYQPKTLSLQDRTEKQLCEELRYIVEDSVKIRVDTDMEYSVFASGGIDSSIIALLAKPKKIFTYIPKSTIQPAEEHYIYALSAYLPETELIRVYGNDNRLLSDLIDIVYINDGPTTTLGALALYNLTQILNSYGIRIVLSGLGADEFLNGYIRHAVTTISPEYFYSNVFKQYQSLITKANLSGQKLTNSEIYYNLLNRSDTQNAKIRKRLEDLFNKNNTLTAISLSDLQFTLPPLLRTDDYITMNFAIENRSPFMDFRFIEFALSIPMDYKIYLNKKSKEIYTKYLLREAFKDILPEVIYKRHDKVGFTSNVSELLRIDMFDIFNTSYNILKTSLPSLKYLNVQDSTNKTYSRWEYQICQLALTYLMFEKKLKKEEIIRLYEMKKNRVHFLENAADSKALEISTHQLNHALVP